MDGVELRLRTLTEDEWREALGTYLRARMQRANVGFPELSQRLRSAGVELDRVPLANKVNRLTFSAPFLLQLLSALEVDDPLLRDVASCAPKDAGG
ncbi:MAG TPA: DUF6471 domain-containing protein [Azospirillaceae bacterium]|nr:DUF6471 domain-containing protein [Azospirillaceae bacterium]